MRIAAALTALAALAATSCSFDASGVGRGGSDDDPTPDAAASATDGPIQPAIDAPPPPVDAAPIDAPPIDAPPQGDGCDEPSDCGGGQACCQYGGLITACAQTCIGGAQVCVDDFDCDGNDVCCDTLFGERECTGFCL